MGSRRDFVWASKANCQDVDIDIFFPGSGEGYKVKIAKKICGGCPVKAECLKQALSNPDEQGVWGGTTPKERLNIRNFQRAYDLVTPTATPSS